MTLPSNHHIQALPDLSAKQDALRNAMLETWRRRWRNLAGPDVNVNQESLRYFIAGEQAYESKHYEDAVQYAALSIQFQPEGAGAYHLRARARAALGRLDGAIDDLTHVIALVPCGPMAYQERGEVYAMQGLVNLARKDFDKAAGLRGEFN
jgi:tetratricopeptide (TPR) repeat protein